MRQALELALEAFEWNYNTDLDNIPACEKWAKMLKEAITAIKEALAQPEQEPVAYQDTADKCRLETVPAKGGLLPQRTWVGLPESAFAGMTLQQVTAMKYAEQILKDQNT